MSYRSTHSNPFASAIRKAYRSKFSEFNTEPSVQGSIFKQSIHMPNKKQRAKTLSPEEIERERLKKHYSELRTYSRSMETNIVDRPGVLSADTKISVVLREFSASVTDKEANIYALIKLVAPGIPYTFLEGITIIPDFVKRCAEKRISSAEVAATLNHVLRHSKFSGYVVDCGRFRIDFTKMGQSSITTLVTLLKNVNNFNKGAWLAALMDLKITKAILTAEDRPTNKKRGKYKSIEEAQVRRDWDLPEIEPSEFDRDLERSRREIVRSARIQAVQSGTVGVTTLLRD